LEDLDFADDVALLSHSHKQMQEKTEQLSTARTQHQQKQDKDYESQDKEQQPHYIERRATGRETHSHTWAAQSTKLEAQKKMSKQEYGKPDWHSSC